MKHLVLSLLLAAGALPAVGETVDVTRESITEWKPIFGEVYTRDILPARARISGVIVALDVTEGDHVQAGQRIARIEDEKLVLQIAAQDAQLEALNAQLGNAKTELERGQRLFDNGTIPQARLDGLKTAVDVLLGQITSTEAQRTVLQRQVDEGDVLAPASGVMLDIPLAKGSVINGGESVGQVGSGGVFLRLSVPERFAGSLAEGDKIEIDANGGQQSGVIDKLYPLIEGGRVQADVTVAGLEDRYIGLRLPVRLPVGDRDAVMVPEAALHRGGGLDYVTVETPEGPMGRVVVPGVEVMRDGVVWREILSGLEAGSRVVIGDE